MSFIIKKANKGNKKMRIALSASSGAGKTYSALLLAYGICGDWSKIGVIDTERGSANLYADFGEYNIIELNEPYTPERYVEAISFFEQAPIEVIIIDSISHEWNGKGGLLESHAKLGGEFRHWGAVTPRHNAFIQKILTSNCHVISTIRRKEDYAIVQSSDGRTKVQKMGLGEVTRDGFSYEMDIVFEIENNNHHASVTKDRTNLFNNADPFLITKDTGKLIKDWADTGVSELDTVIQLINETLDLDGLKTIHLNYTSLHNDPLYVKAKDKKRNELKNLKT